MSDVINYVLHTSKNISMEMIASSGTDMLVEADSSRQFKKTLRGVLGTPEGADVPSVFVECFRFLKALAKNNIVVQRRSVVTHTNGHIHTHTKSVSHSQTLTGCLSVWKTCWMWTLQCLP